MDIKLNIFFFNTLCSNRVFDWLFVNHNVKSSNSAQKFFNLLANGLAENQKVSVKVTSILPINSKEQQKFLWRLSSEKENKIKFSYIPLINISILRNIFCSIYVFFYILFKKFPLKEQNVVLVDYLRFSINISVVLASKIRRIKVLAVVTDLPGYDVISHSIKVKLRNLIVNLIEYGYYICLTRSLNEMVNNKNKPFLIIEGFVDHKLLSKTNNINNKFNERVIVYAGSLYERYGLKTLLEAFSKIPDNDLRLWIFGVGPFSRSIDTFAQADERICNKGVIPNSELMEILYRSTLLVNPRPTHEKYTLYSFPSKNLEYMSTGTPLLTTKLDGIPADHYPYVYFIENDIDGIYKGLIKVLNKSRSEIHSFGLASKEFTLREKSNVRQAEKIITLLKNNL